MKYIILGFVAFLATLAFIHNSPKRINGEVCECDSIYSQYDGSNNVWVETEFHGNDVSIREYRLENNQVIARVK